MKLRNGISFVLMGLALTTLLYMGCEVEEEGWPSGPDVVTPVITGITPEAGYGGDQVTITGENFNADHIKNLITFGFLEDIGYVSVRPDAGTATSLTFTLPMISGVAENIVSPVTVSNLDDPTQTRSNADTVAFLPLIDIFADGFEDARGITVDPDGNLYVCDPKYGEGLAAIYKITPAGEKSVYAEFSTEDAGMGDIAMNAAGDIFVGGHWEQCLHKIPAGGGDLEFFAEIIHPEMECPPQITMDLDANDNLYIGAAWPGAIWRVTPAGEVTLLVESDWFMSVQVYDGYLYWFERELASLSRAEITAEGIGEPEVLYEMEEPEYETYWPTGIEIDELGRVYLGGGQCCEGGFEWQYYTLDRIDPDESTFEQVFELPTPNFKYLAFSGDYLYVTAHYNEEWTEVTGGLVYSIYLRVGEGAP